MGKRNTFVPLDQPFFHADHPRPRTRRQFLAQGFATGTGMALTGSLSLLTKKVEALTVGENLVNCPTGDAAAGNGKIPFICFDLAGGANIAGSNVLVGKEGGQLDFLATAGYNKQGLPGDQLPQVNAVDPANTDNTNGDFGLYFHADSQMLRGMQEKAGTISNSVNGAVIAARSQNDTGNNPHNPMYGIARAGFEAKGLGGAMGDVVALIGSRNSDSGGNSMAPQHMIDLAYRPSKVDRPSDVNGMVDLGGLYDLPGEQLEKTRILEASYRISDAKIAQMATKLQEYNDGSGSGIGGLTDAQLRDAIRCAYAQTADLSERFSDGLGGIDPVQDADIVGPNGIFSQAEFDGDREFQKTASVMKMVVTGLAGAGTITMGGYDYHTGDRRTGEARDLRAGRCIGACLAYAARRNQPLMIYVVSDGSVFSNGMIDNSIEGGGKGVWTGDSQQTAAAFFLVYDPNGSGRPILRTSIAAPSPEMHQQLGFMDDRGDTVIGSSPASNDVNALVYMIIYNYMALHGEEGEFENKFPEHNLTFPIVNGQPDRERWLAFEAIVGGRVGNPPA